MTDTIRYEHIEGNRYRAILPGGAVEVHSTYERCYPGLPAPDGTERGALHLDLYGWSTAHLAGMTRIGDVACGSGYGTAYLTELGYDTIGADCDPEAVAYARARYPGIAFIETRPGLGWGETGAFDAIVSVETIEHIDHDARELRDWHRMLRPGGIVVVTTPCWDGRRPLLTEHHVREYTPERLAALLDVTGFDVVFHAKQIGVRRLHQGIVGVRR